MTIPANGKRYIFVALAALILGAAGAFYIMSPAIGPVPDAVRRDFAARFSQFEALDPPRPLEHPLALLTTDEREWPWANNNGRITLVNFWALWCPPCLRELPSLARLAEERAGQDFAVVYVSMDFAESGAALTEVMSFKKVPPIDTLYIRDLESWESLKLKALPTTLILDRRGRVAYRMGGDIDWTGPQAKAFLDAVLQ